MSPSREGREPSSLTGCRRGLRLDEVLFPHDLRERVPNFLAAKRIVCVEGGLFGSVFNTKYGVQGTEQIVNTF